MIPHFLVPLHLQAGSASADLSDLVGRQGTYAPVLRATFHAAPREKQTNVLSAQNFVSLLYLQEFRCFSRKYIN